jgi:hypothetical protein
MRPTLPRGLFRKVRGFGTLLSPMLVTLTVGCQHVVKDAPAKPGPAILAEPEIDLENMDTECAGLLAAVETYGQCPNLDDPDRIWARNVIDALDRSFRAGKKSNPDEPSQKAIALACRRAAISFGYATERCRAGKRPRID